jgi:putative membrane protein
MRNLSIGLALLACAMFTAAAVAADDKAAELDKLFIEEAGVHGQFEQQISEAAAQQASDSQVKDFAQKMVQDHKQANEQLKQVAQKVGANVPQQLPEMKQRELDAIKAQQGKEFDQAYVSCMKKMHMADVSAFADKAQTAKNQDVKQFASQTLPTLQQHQQHVIQIATAQGLPNPMGDAQTAGARISSDSSSGHSGHGQSDKAKSGEGPDAGHRGTQGQGQDQEKSQRSGSDSSK